MASQEICPTPNALRNGILRKVEAGEALDHKLVDTRDWEGPVAEPMVRVITEETRDLLRLGDEGPSHRETPIRYRLVPLSTLGDLRAQRTGKRVLSEIGKANREDAERAAVDSAPRGLSVNGGKNLGQSAR